MNRDQIVAHLMLHAWAPHVSVQGVICVRQYPSLLRVVHDPRDTWTVMFDHDTGILETYVSATWEDIGDTSLKCIVVRMRQRFVEYPSYEI